MRFQENSLVYGLVRSTIKHRLLRENLIPQLTVPQGEEVGVKSETVPVSVLRSTPRFAVPS